MYTVGSLFYAIYFFVSFPMFFRMDEDTKVTLAAWLPGCLAAWLPGWLAVACWTGCARLPAWRDVREGW